MSLRNRHPDRADPAAVFGYSRWDECLPPRHPQERAPVVAVVVAQTPETAAQIVRQNLRIAEVERQLREVRAEIGRLAKKQGARAVHAREPDPCLADVVGITQEMFSGKVHVELVNDPEEPEHSYVVFRTSATGEISDIVEKRIEWHRRIMQLSPGSSGSFRLSIDPL